MSRFAPSYAYRLEYLILVEPRPDGPVMGYFDSKPFSSAVVDCFGRRYLFAGLAPRHRDGRYDIEGLALGERLIEPGLVYRMEVAPKRPAWSGLMARLSNVRLDFGGDTTFKWNRQQRI